VARKHISWYTRGLPGSAAFRHRMNQLESIAEQFQTVNEFFDEQQNDSSGRLHHIEGLAA
jgi:tRNA-dihydrouridine synthase B